ncbi:MAG: SurA N-terminal domain-containing protein [Elusimicrobia bacterium]|nr:SurA N-terminal domain-containing protein [Elusimicrobiota bacterium]
MNWFHKNRKKIFLFVIAIFVIGSFAGFGSYFLTQSPFDAAIQVNGRKIPYKQFESLYQRVIEEQRQRSPDPLTDPQREYIKRQVVQSLVQEEVFLMEAEKLGIHATDAELAQVIQSIPVFQREGRFDVRTYQEILGRLRLRVEDFEAEQRRQLKVQKAQFVMASGVKLSSLEIPAKVQAALAQAKEEDRKKMLENMDGFRENLRRQEVQACLQEWYGDINTRLKVKVLLNKLEPGPKPSTPAVPTPTAPLN